MTACRTTVQPEWQNFAARVKARVDSAIPPSYLANPSLIPRNLEESVIYLPQQSGVLSLRELEITDLNAVNLLPMIWDKSYSAVEVSRAFCKRAAIAHLVTNCIAHVMFDDAIHRACELDEHLERTGKPIGPLHGLPISVKEHIYLEGTPATAGFIAWADDISEHDALIVKILREAGAVFHVKTTNPQGLMIRLLKRPGGSSDGEGALIAMRGSLLGIGTDMGGSIRAPAAFSGIYGLKPSCARKPHSGLAGMNGGMETIVGIVGPMATCIADLRLFQTVVLAKDPWKYEPSLIRMPWISSPSPLPKKLKIGLISHDSYVQPHPPIPRALQKARKALQAQGHEVIECDTTLHKTLHVVLHQMFFLDAAQEFRDIFAVGKEPCVEIVQDNLNNAPERAYTVEETWKTNGTSNALQTAYATLWNDTSMDFILCPANPAAAPAHDSTRWDAYTGVWNLLDYSAITFPVTTVLDTDTYDNFPRQSETPLSAKDAYYLHDYSPQKFKNAPVALQVVGRRFEEEKILDCVEILKECLERGL